MSAVGEQSSTALGAKLGMNEEALDSAVEKIAPPGYESETRRYLVRIFNNKDTDNRVTLMFELSELIHKDPEQITKALFDVSAEQSR